MKTIKGDLLDLFLNGEYDVIIHGANCLTAMGAGIAGQIAKRIPEAKLADDNYNVNHDVEKLGGFSYTFVRRVMPDRTINIGTVINLYTQYYPGPALDEEALVVGFRKLARILDRNRSIGIPLIGCGIAGGDWDVISNKIEYIMRDHDITVVEFQKQKEKNEIKIEEN